MRVAYIAALALAITAVDVQAQFTAVVTPPKKDQKQAALTEAQKKARADSVHRATVASMRAWVDSAAIALAAGGADTTRRATLAADTAAAARDSVARVARESAGDVAAPRARPARPAPARRTPTAGAGASTAVAGRTALAADTAMTSAATDTSATGRRAPDTATPMPALALGGAALLGLGILLGRRRRA